MTNPINAYFLSPDRNDVPFQRFTNEHIYSTFFEDPMPSGLDPDGEELQDHFFENVFFDGGVNDVYSYAVHRICSQHNWKPQRVFSSMDAWENYESGMIDAINLACWDDTDVYRAYIWNEQNPRSVCELHEAKIKEELLDCLRDLLNSDEEEECV